MFGNSWHVIRLKFVGGLLDGDNADDDDDDDEASMVR